LPTGCVYLRHIIFSINSDYSSNSINTLLSVRNKWIYIWNLNYEIYINFMLLIYSEYHLLSQNAFCCFIVYKDVQHWSLFGDKSFILWP
jgi:hypothetical protein